MFDKHPRLKVTFVLINLVFPVFHLNLSIDRRNWLQCWYFVPNNPKIARIIVNQRDPAYAFRNIFETFRQTSLSQCKRTDERSFVLDRISGAKKKRNVGPVCVSKFLEKLSNLLAPISRFGVHPSIRPSRDADRMKKSSCTRVENWNSYSMILSIRINDRSIVRIVVIMMIIKFLISFLSQRVEIRDSGFNYRRKEDAFMIEKIDGIDCLLFFHYLIQNVIKEESICVYVCLFIAENCRSRKGISLSIINTLNVARSLKILMEFQVESFHSSTRLQEVIISLDVFVRISSSSSLFQH